MPDLSTYLAFVAASIVIILVPGPAQALVLARTMAQGRRAGVWTAIGLNVGTLFHTLMAAWGLSALLATSALAFSVVKYVGAAYLVYLGIRAWRAGAGLRPDAAPAGSVLRQAVLTGVLNPKVALFFLAFLPQFVDPSRGAVFLQFLLLGATIAVLDTLYEVALVALAARVQSRWGRSPRLQAWQSRVSGAVLVALGARLAVQER